MSGQGGTKRRRQDSALPALRRLRRGEDSWEWEDITIASPPSDSRSWRRVMQEVVDSSHDSSAGGYQLVVERVDWLNNSRALSEYERNRRRLAYLLKETLPLGVADVVTPPRSLHRRLPAYLTLRGPVNECFLLHGTTPEAVDSIAGGAQCVTVTVCSLSVSTADGFDERMCSTDSLLGQGVYFTGSSNKSDQYTKACDRGLRYMFLARVALGHPLLLPREIGCSTRSALKEFPTQKAAAASIPLWDDRATALSSSSQRVRAPNAISARCKHSPRHALTDQLTQASTPFRNFLSPTAELLRDHDERLLM